MTRTKGGERESGGFFSCQFCGAKLPPEGKDPNCCEQMREVVAAANPAALRSIEAFRRDGWCAPEHFTVLDGDIRALETERDWWEDAQQTTMDNLNILQTENDALKARVAELEDRIESEGMHIVRTTLRERDCGD
jgi:hypothetical protein